MSRTRKPKQKSPSERLRGVYYNLWEQDAEGHEEFETYYNSKMEKLIIHFKKMIKD